MCLDVSSSKKSRRKSLALGSKPRLSCCHVVGASFADMIFINCYFSEIEVIMYILGDQKSSYVILHVGSPCLEASLIALWITVLSLFL